MKEENLLKIMVEGDHLIIKIATGDLVNLAENKPDAQYTILDKDKFIKEMIFQLENIESFSNNENNTQLQEIFDTAIDEVYMYGSGCIVDAEEAE